MFASLATSWALGKASWRVLRSNPALALFPVVSTAVLLLIVAVTGGLAYGIFPWLRDGVQPQGGQAVAGAVTLFVFMAVAYTIVIYFNSALTAAVMQQLEGGAPSLKDGLRLAGQHKRAIVGYALISATVGVVLSIIREKGGIAGQIVSWVGDIAWGLASFFVVPVLVTRNIGPIDAIRESGGLFKRTWGQQVAGNAGVGLFSFALLLAAIAIGGVFVTLGAAIGLLPLLIFGIVVGVVLIAGALTIGATLSSIFRVVLYRFATNGQVAEPFDDSDIRNAFRPKRAGRIAI
jgi:hypothetical protein